MLSEELITPFKMGNSCLKLVLAGQTTAMVEVVGDQPSQQEWAEDKDAETGERYDERVVLLSERAGNSYDCDYHDNPGKLNRERKQLTDRYLAHIFLSPTLKLSGAVCRCPL